jgi:hypothetical protein
MSVIAWDGRSLAADRRVVNGNLINVVSKAFACRDRIVACSGDVQTSEEILDWMDGGNCHPPDYPAAARQNDETSVAVILPEGGIWIYRKSPFPMKLPPQNFAMGCGRDFAIAAMHCGKTAVEAVAITSLYDCFCGNGIDEFRYEPDGTITHIPHL